MLDDLNLTFDLRVMPNFWESNAFIVCPSLLHQQASVSFEEKKYGKGNKILPRTSRGAFIDYFCERVEAAVLDV